MSADFHKHGYAAKGASVLLLPDEPAQAIDFVYSDHPLPTMATETLAGTAPGAPFASAWAVMRYLGIDGYRRLAHDLSAARRAFVEAVGTVPGFAVLGDPLFSLAVVTSPCHDMKAVHQRMAARGWFTLAVTEPPGLHLNIGAGDGALAGRFADDLRAVGEEL
jgi:glutamate/tyrosine decarboxylase-like PLP-dependent enzyme